ncbi:MAG TPA: hypothetical protein VMZ69_07265 [Saprospiraceae bacterium]|nr:hypothetical protein [Saprospiraceae bacterium]
MQQLTKPNILFAFAGIFICFMLLKCAQPEKKQTEHETTLNTSHLDALYEEIKLGEDSVGIVHIYSEYPDYHFVGDADEGMACVDDVSRAAIFYLRQYQSTTTPEYLHKGRMLIKFLLAMQAPNGYYYNFIFPDGTINKEGSTSMPVPNFWAWRTLWAFGEALNVLEANDPLRNMIRLQRGRLAMNILLENSFKSNQTDTAMGVAFATWLPKTSGTDQASIVLIGLSLMLQQESNVDSMRGGSLVDLMEHFADGIMLMQIEQPDSLHDGAFLSWENLWHAYANVQSYALMMTGQVLDDPHMISHGLYEVDHFYPSFLKAGGLEHFFVKIEDNKITRYDTKSFSQIAYGRRPMIWAALKAYEITKEEKYLSLAKELGEWFSGKNPANVPMFDTATGRGYDGITGPGEYNKNSGAESTIEALLALQAMQLIN